MECVVTAGHRCNMFNTLGAMYSSVYLVSDVTQEKLTTLIVYKD